MIGTDDLRTAFRGELGMHVDAGPSHPGKCLCGTWDGSDSFNDHLADALIAAMVTLFLLEP